MSGVIAKPQLRGILISKIRFHISVAVCLSIAGSFAAKFLYRDARREKVQEFYRTYDVEKENARLKAMGLFRK